MRNKPFWKLHGLGNDFIFFDAMKSDLDLTAGEVAALCDRRCGIGADGVIVVKPSPRAQCAGYMYYINADGTLAQMCGNGVRCFAKFLVDRGYVDRLAGVLTADTLSGPKPITFETDRAGLLTTATVDMGAPVLRPAEIPCALEANTATIDGVPFAAEVELASPWGPFAFTCVSMGNPHAVCFLDDGIFATLPEECFTAPERSLSTLDVNRIGDFFESHEAFPEKTNVEFAVVRDADAIAMRVYERGCGETTACGTGACATQVAAHLLGRTGEEVDVALLGGVLHIALVDGRVVMTGPACESFEGIVDIGGATGVAIRRRRRGGTVCRWLDLRCQHAMLLLRCPRCACSVRFLLKLTEESELLCKLLNASTTWHLICSRRLTRRRPPWPNKASK